MKITKQFTNREAQSLDKYLQEIGKVDLLTAEQEVELAIKIKQGDPQALEKLTKANLRFVEALTKPESEEEIGEENLIFGFLTSWVFMLTEDSE